MPPLVAIAPAILAIAAGVTAAGAVAGTTISAVQGKQQKDEAQKAAAQQQQEQQRLLKEKSNQEQIERAALQRDQSRQRQRAAAGAAGGRSGTILTGPLGVPGNAAQNAAAPQGNKTLLGT